MQIIETKERKRGKMKVDGQLNILRSIIQNKDEMENATRVLGHQSSQL